MDLEAIRQRAMEAALREPPSEAQLASLKHYYGYYAPDYPTRYLATRWLSVRDYVEAAAYHVFIKRDVPITHEHCVHTAIDVLNIPSLYEFIEAWNKRRLAQRGSGIPASLRETPELIRVAQLMLDNIENVS